MDTSFNQLGAPERLVGKVHGSLAQTLLNADIDDGKHTRMKPQVLHGTREEYEVFDLTVFRKHLRQEVQARKFWVYMAEKKKQKIERRRMRGSAEQM
jgi:hypothetical protein